MNMKLGLGWGFAAMVLFWSCSASGAPLQPQSKDAYLESLAAFVGYVRENRTSPPTPGWWDKQNLEFDNFTEWYALFEFRLSERVFVRRLKVEFVLMMMEAEATAIRDMFADDFRRLREALQGQDAQ